MNMLQVLFFFPLNPPVDRQKVPLILGHEFSGEVAEVGRGVEGIEVGDIVAPWPVLNCGKCYSCKRVSLSFVK